MENTRELIIKNTIQLIEQSHGNIAEITTRKIAAQAHVGIGLINYYFTSKEQLITYCVQQIIDQVVQNFTMTQPFTQDADRLTAWATLVFDFLFEHEALSKISILGDLHDYRDPNNSLQTQRGLRRALHESREDNDLIVFTLVSTMQTAFLAYTVHTTILNYDFSQPEQRSAFIKQLVARLLQTGTPS